MMRFRSISGASALVGLVGLVAPLGLAAELGCSGAQGPGEAAPGVTTNAGGSEPGEPGAAPNAESDDAGAGSDDSTQAAWWWPFPLPTRDAGLDAASDAGRDASSDAGTSPLDGGAPDASPVDAGARDASPIDAGSPSSGGARVPSPTGVCPTLTATGSGSTTLTFAGQQVTVWAGAKSARPGPLVLYWYATGGSASQAAQVLGSTLSSITAAGGVVVAPNKTTGQGATTNNNVWYTGDLAIADEVAACAVQQGYVDPDRIHVLGYSAGALQTVYMSFARSGYVASVVSYSGGEIGINKTAYQNPGHIPPAVAAHGKSGTDSSSDYIFGVDFAATSKTWENDIVAKKGFVIDCDDGSTHVDMPKRVAIAPAVWQFFVDHPFGATPEPYAGGLSTRWPSYCFIVR